MAVDQLGQVSGRSVKPTAEGQDWSGRLARMPSWLGYILLLVIWASVWNGGDTTEGRFRPARSGDLRAGAAGVHMVTPGAGQRVERRCRIEAGAQAGGTGTVCFCAASDLHGTS